MNEYKELVRNVANEYIKKKYKVDAESFRLKFSASRAMSNITKTERLLLKNPNQLPSVKGTDGDDVATFVKIVEKMNYYG